MLGGSGIHTDKYRSAGRRETVRRQASEGCIPNGKRGKRYAQMQRGTRLTLQVVQKGCVRFAQGAEKQLSCLPQAGQTSEPFARNPSTQPACASRPQPAAKPSPFLIYICARRAPPHPLNLLNLLNLLNPGPQGGPNYAIIHTRCFATGWSRLGIIQVFSLFP